MRRQPLLCPVHVYERMLCDGDCLSQRLKLRRIQADYCQYWYDRRHGIKPMSLEVWRHHYDRRPIYLAWSAA